MGRRYGLSDRAVAERYGYRMPDWTIGSAKPQSIDEFSKEEQAVLTGFPKMDGGKQYQGKQIPERGCMGQAQRTVGEFDSQSSLANRLQKKTFQQLPNEPGARAVIAKWSQCMEGRGYHYGGPWDAGNDFVGSNDGNTRASRAEIRSAVAAVDCTYRTNLLGVLFAVESDLQNAEIEKNAQALSKEKKQVEAQARHLQALTKQYGG
jgi:hypothetical protein